MLEKLRTERGTAESVASENSNNVQVRLLVPAALCGGIIGRKGATIRSFGEDSGANITVSAQNRQPPGVPERVVRITGELQPSGHTGLLKAVELITDKMVESPHYSRVAKSSVSYGRPGMFDTSQNPGVLLLPQAQSLLPIPGCLRLASSLSPVHKRLEATSHEQKTPYKILCQHFASSCLFVCLLTMLHKNASCHIPVNCSFFPCLFRKVVCINSNRRV